MKINAIVIGNVIRKEIAKDQVKYKGKSVEDIPIDEKYIFHTLNVIDSDAPGNLQKTLVLDVHENDVAEARTLQGKSVVLNVYAAENKKGIIKTYYGGRSIAAAAPVQQKAVNS